MERNISLQAAVYCTDGRLGQIMQLLVDPDKQLLRSLVIRDEAKPHTEYVVPIAQIADAAHRRVDLNCDLTRARASSRLRTVEYYSVGSGSMTKFGQSAYVTLPPNVVQIDRQTLIKAADKRFGHVDELTVDLPSGRISAYGARQGLLAQQLLLIPADYVTRVQKAAILIHADKSRLAELVRVPLRQLR